jgi:formylglycine-generating enzyme required for sulfatase activity
LALDNRKGVGLRAGGLPDIDWVEIAGGEFVYQEGERRKTEAFLMARYPVTNAQFQAFVDAKDGYADDRWWRGLDKPDRTPRAGAWREGNHPRETVSWYEAMAFCAWLGYRLKLDVRLPTEWQWERAARGRYGREFPWGKEYVAGYANINETYQKAGPHSLARTSPVGIYPQGGSLDEKVLDLAGNVWEWCLNEYKNPERIQAGGTGSRVLRGGSWRYDPDFARAQARNDDGPGSRSFSFGFRVVAVLSPMKN